jgi:hypothetical protein
LWPSIFLSTLFSYTLSLCSYRNVRDKISHPYKTVGKVIVLHIYIFTFLDSRREGCWFRTKCYQSLPQFNILDPSGYELSFPYYLEETQSLKDYSALNFFIKQIFVTAFP